MATELQKLAIRYVADPHHLNDTLGHHVMKLGALIDWEQQKPLPDNDVISALCDSIRLACEHERLLQSRPL